jgi:plastocyanin
MRLAKVCRIVVPIVLASLIAAAVAVAAPTVGVKHKGQKYHWSPSSLTVKKGTTVTWKWTGKIPHNVTGKGFSSKTAPKLTYSHKFTKAGTYKVVCTIHKSVGQKMTIHVH